MISSVIMNFKRTAEPAIESLSWPKIDIDETETNVAQPKTKLFATVPKNVERQTPSRVRNY
jgi:hypothetical protein